MENRYNLLDEQWIPVVGAGKVGLKRIFSDASLPALGGNPVEKIAVFKLLLAIAQSACTPKDEAEWEALGCDGMKAAVLAYLDSHRDCFWLYGDKPFLQMPEIAEAINCSDKKKLIPVKLGNGIFPDLWADNNTIVSDYDSLDITYESDKLALYLIMVQNFALKGKQVNNKIKIDIDLPPKGVVANPGPSLGFNRFLHSFIFLNTVLKSVYLNLLSLEDIEASNIVTALGTPFWERMPKSENDEIARESKGTLLGHLMPLSRFIYFTDKGLFFTEGIVYHRSNKEAKKKKIDELPWREFSTSWRMNEKGEMKYLSADVSKRPWRLLTSLLVNKLDVTEFQNIGIRIAVKKLLAVSDYETFHIWSGGLDVGSDPFDMKVKGKDDYVESELLLPKSIFFDSQNASFFGNLSYAMFKMNQCEKVLENHISSYLMELKNKKSIKERLCMPKEEFWQCCELEFQSVIDICAGNDVENNLQPVYKKFWSFVCRIYDENCPKDTARQMEAWAKNKPKMNTGKEVK